jgi:hypothetical protein
VGRQAIAEKHEVTTIIRVDIGFSTKDTISK